MKIYLDLMQEILTYGAVKGDRTGTGTRSVFGRQLRFDLAQGFPVLTTKKLHWPSIVHELLWFLRGETNIRALTANGVRIWNEWATADGDLGPIYGKQWRAWAGADGETIDQISQVLAEIKTNPDSRRLIVSAWNVADLPDSRLSPQQNVAAGKMALAACHAFFQFYVVNGQLSCQLYARSQDYFLGTPFNIASYALLVHLMAQQCDLAVGELVWTGGDVHLYANHLQQAQLQLEREPYPLPQMRIKRRADSIFEYQADDFELVNYQAHPSIRAPISV